MLDSKPQPTPMVSSLRLIVNDSVSVDDLTLYCSVVGAQQYVTLNRLELSFSVSKVCQYMHKPQLTNWKVVNRIICYLIGIATKSLRFYSSASYSIIGFSDSNCVIDKCQL